MGHSSIIVTRDRYGHLMPGNECEAGPCWLKLPNVGALPWEAVMEFREHPGCEDARGKFREWEERAADAAPENSKQVGREVVSGAWAAVTDLAPKLTRELQEEIHKALFGMIPVVGKFGQVLDSVETIAEAEQFRRTWIAAIMRLRASS